MTGKHLKSIRKSSGLTLKQFYEEKLGMNYYTVGLNAEKSYVVPESIVERLKNAGFDVGGGEK